MALSKDEEQNLLWQLTWNLQQRQNKLDAAEEHRVEYNYPGFEDDIARFERLAQEHDAKASLIMSRLFAEGVSGDKINAAITSAQNQ